MTEKELDKIREYIIDNVMTDADIMFSDDRINGVDLPEIIASLYELLHQQVTGKPYQYFHHFANKIGSDVDDDLFVKELIFNKKQFVEYSTLEIGERFKLTDDPNDNRVFRKELEGALEIVDSNGYHYEDIPKEQKEYSMYYLCLTTPVYKIKY